MRRPTATKASPDAATAGDAILTQWRMQTEPPPPDNLLHGRYWEDEMPLPDTSARAGSSMLALAAVLVSVGAAMGVALSYFR